MTDKVALYDISIVIPCYQEEGHLRDSVQAIHDLLNATKYSFEMIFVDDCSKDKTRDVILSIVKDFSNTKYLFHKTNVGRGGTFLDGVNISRGKYVGFLDIDLEVSCVYLLSVISELEKGFDVCTVHRHYALLPSPVFILRHILSVGYKILISKYLSIPRMDTETGFKFFRKECIVKLSREIQNKKWFFDTEVMVLSYLRKYKIKEVDGLFMRKSEKNSTVRIFNDTIDYFVEVYKFKQRIKKRNSTV
ncbi:MAG: glycosyltransferase [Bacteroidetes bacterium]|nr:MAG: glycosyltransferase [Bacteroidota bacterium]